MTATSGSGTTPARYTVPDPECLPSGIFAALSPDYEPVTDDDREAKRWAEASGGRVFVALSVLEYAESEVDRLREALNGIAMTAIEEAEQNA